MNKVIIYFIIVFIFKSVNLMAQKEQFDFKGGLSFESGLSYLAIKDEFISKEKYTGVAPIYNIYWTKNYDDYRFCISFEMLNSAKIKNYNISAKATELSLNLSYLYSIGNLSIFNKKAQFFLGPYPEIFLHFRSENIAKGGNAFFDAYSFATLVSLGAKLKMELQLSNFFLLEGQFNTNVFSLAGKLVDPKNNNDQMIKFTTLFSDIRTSLKINIKYHMFSKLDIATGYRFNISNINSWDYLVSANDNYFLSLTYTL